MKEVWPLAAALVAACSVTTGLDESAIISCIAPQDCPEDRVCLVGFCRRTDAECIDKVGSAFEVSADGTICRLTDSSDGVCAGGGCVVSACGDGIVHVGTEGCDDGNGVVGDDCPDGPDGTCLAAFCGDGFVRSGDEVCDDGNQANDDDCPDGDGGTCRPAACGDGHVQMGVEACDDANQDDGDGCRGDCQKIEICGDGVRDAGESCDGGDTRDGDGCSSACTIEAGWGCRGAGLSRCVTVLYVDADASPVIEDGRTWGNALGDLHDALEARTSEAEIWVAAGTYSPPGGALGTGSFALPNNLALYGGFAGGETDPDLRVWESNPTILDGQNDAEHVIVIDTHSDNIIIDGFIIRRGNATTGGGGIDIRGLSWVTVRNTVFEDNQAMGNGGGISVTQGQLTLDNVAFHDNHAAVGGGALGIEGPLYAVSVEITRSRFYGNDATVAGGAVYNQNGWLEVDGCELINNTSSSNGGAIWSSGGLVRVNDSRFEQNSAREGGAMYSASATDPDLLVVVDSSVWIGNSATGTGLDVGGGAIQIAADSARITTCAFYANSAVDTGGAILATKNVLIANSLLSGNTAPTGAALFLDDANTDALSIINVTIVGSTDGAAVRIPNLASVAIHGSIIWGNSGGSSSLGVTASPEAWFSCIEGGWTEAGSGNIAADPQLVDADGADNIFGTEDDTPHLQATSPAIDAGPGPGSAGQLVGIVEDLAGNPRIVDIPGVGPLATPVVDMGAFEAQ